MRTVDETHDVKTWAMGVVAALALVACGAALNTLSAQTVRPAPGKGEAANAEAQAASRKEAAKRAFDAGVKSFEAGKTEPAIKSLSTALATGGLESQDMAKALYYRGVAYRKQGKPAQAISDLTSAIWLKNGLGDRERSDATENRAAAYRDAGVSEKALPWSPPDAAGKSGEGSTPGEDWKTTTGTAAPRESAEPPRPEPAAAPASESKGGGFFSSLFGGSGSSADAAPPPAPPPTATPPAPPGPPEPALSSWSNAVTVSPAPAKKIAATEPAKQWAPLAPASEGKYRLQIATVRSREEADALAARLRAEHEASLGAATLAVNETLVGNMGTFFRVQAGPYPTAEESRRVCEGLKASGYDCLVVTQ